MALSSSAKGGPADETGTVSGEAGQEDIGFFPPYGGTAPEGGASRKSIMHSLYIIKSERAKQCYIGVAEDVSKRIQEHNSGDVRSTKAFRPYILIHTRSFNTLSEARAEERKIKKAGHIKRYLKNFGPIV